VFGNPKLNGRDEEQAEREIEALES